MSPDVLKKKHLFLFQINLDSSPSQGEPTSVTQCATNGPITEQPVSALPGVQPISAVQPGPGGHPSLDDQPLSTDGHSEGPKELTRLKTEIVGLQYYGGKVSIGGLCTVYSISL